MAASELMNSWEIWGVSQKDPWEAASLWDLDGGRKEIKVSAEFDEENAATMMCSSDFNTQRHGHGSVIRHAVSVTHRRCIVCNVRRSASLAYCLTI
ncbi:hypothetical protein RvY_00187 [Ramazzottius varieornatus]|uniref:Uncharacterized protein n=1 Tax=Ramazzottius varieornatus TaxID=947166 RepID=A0A1D1UFK1_RAMVA|nr:hypothetical protein RvY_00187 [Ramazzottius varieornatus]